MHFGFRCSTKVSGLPTMLLTLPSTRSSREVLEGLGKTGIREVLNRADRADAVAPGELVPPLVTRVRARHFPQRVRTMVEKQKPLGIAMMPTCRFLRRSCLCSYFRCGRNWPDPRQGLQPRKLLLRKRTATVVEDDRECSSNARVGVPLDVTSHLPRRVWQLPWS